MQPAQGKQPNRSWWPVGAGDRWQLAALLAWSVVLLAVCGRAGFAPRSHSVYTIYAAAGRHWAAGTDLYRLVDDPYRYSPLTAALLVPFGLLPDRLGGVAWRLGMAGVYLAALAWWARAALPRRLGASQVGVLFLLALPLSVGSLNNAQSNVLVLGLLLAGITAAVHERWLLSSACIAVASYFKLYPLAVGLLLGVVFPRTYVLRLLAALAVGLALPYLLQQPAYVAEQYASWFAQLQFDDRSAWPVEYAYRDVRLLGRACGVALRPGAYLVLQLATAAACAGACLAGRLRGWPPRRLLALLLGLACSWMTLFGSATESCTYILLAPTLAWTVLEAFLERWPAPLRLGLLASYALFTATQAVVWFGGIARHFHGQGPHALAGLLLLVCLVAGAWRRGGSPGDAPLSQPSAAGSQVADRAAA